MSTYASDKILFKEYDPVQERFFAEGNKNRIHELIIEDVFKASHNQFKISRQSDNELTIIMTWIYNEYGQYSNETIDAQIARLNKRTSLECTKLIIPQIQQHVVYLDTMSSNRKVLDHGVSTSGKGLNNTVNTTNLMF